MIGNVATCFGGPRHGFSYPINESRKLRVVVHNKFQQIPVVALPHEPILKDWDEFEYTLERYSNGLPGQYFYAWIAHGWWVNGYEAKDYVLAGLEMVRLLSLIGECEPWEEKRRGKFVVSDFDLIAWAENNGIIDQWCRRAGRNPQRVKRIVTRQNLYQLNGMLDPFVVKLSGWDSDPDFARMVEAYLFRQNPRYVFEEDIRAG